MLILTTSIFPGSLAGYFSIGLNQNPTVTAPSYAHPITGVTRSAAIGSGYGIHRGEVHVQSRVAHLVPASSPVLSNSWLHRAIEAQYNVMVQSPSGAP